MGEPALTVGFAVPDGWVRRPAGAIQSTWRSPDSTHEMSVKRDTSYGATPREASVGQLAWYRDTAASSMAALKAVTHTTRQNGKDALWLEIDYHWAGQTEPRKRVEVFVAGSAGHVYQLLLDTAAGPGNRHLATQRELFATARAHLLIDRNAPRVSCAALTPATRASCYPSSRSSASGSARSSLRLTETRPPVLVSGFSSTCT